MSSVTDKINGTANKIAGNVKESVGKASGDRDLEAEGVVQQGKGSLQKAAGEVKSAIKKVIDKA